jgi:hypothetical protein
VIGMRRALQAFLDSQPLSGGPLEVELRELDPTSDPRSGLEVEVPPMVVLWVEERPLAVRLREVVAVCPSPSGPGLSVAVEADCLSAGLAVEHMGEAALWRLFSAPARPRLAR